MAAVVAENPVPETDTTIVGSLPLACADLVNPKTRMEHHVAKLAELHAVVLNGGGADKIAKQHAQGKLTARERIGVLLAGEPFYEIGALRDYDKNKGETPGAGVVTGFGKVGNREVVLVVNDATVKAGSWQEGTIQKILRAQEIAMRTKTPIIYLVDAAGGNLNDQEAFFPGKFGASRIFYYNSIMRRYLKVPQIAAVMGQCVAGGAYLPALCDVVLMVEGTSFMGLAGPNLVKGATGQKVDSEPLGGAKMHNRVSGVAQYKADDDMDCLRQIRMLVEQLPVQNTPKVSITNPVNPVRPIRDIYDIFPVDHRAAYDARAIIDCLIDGGTFNEFHTLFAQEVITGDARIGGIHVGIVANSRGLFPRHDQSGPPKFGGIIYNESADKMARFIENCNRAGTPILFLHDVSGFMVGVEAEQRGIINAGARLVEAMATATVPILVLTLNHASGAGYYAMAGQGFDPDFVYTLPTGRMAVMEPESAIVAMFGPTLEKLASSGQKPDENLIAQMEEIRLRYNTQIDAVRAAARGYVDAVLVPEQVRETLIASLRLSLNNPGPHLGDFVLYDQ